MNRIHAICSADQLLKLFRRDNQYHLVLGPLKDNLCAERIADEAVSHGGKRCQNKSHQSRDFANLGLVKELDQADMSTAAIEKVNCSTRQNSSGLLHRARTSKRSSFEG